MNWNNCEFLASYGLSRQLPVSDRPEIVFSGRSNVGKSSLINKLCSRKNLARVSSTPGKTATINFYRMDRAYLVDLPGYGYAKVSNADKLKKSQKAACKAEFEQVCAPYGCRAVFLTSAEKGDGVEALRLCLERYLSGEPGDGV